jgi:methionyl-tRNA synthetase
VNYISFAPGYDPAPGADLAEFKRWWASVAHVIGKDILIPAHGIYWPVMLKALDFTAEEMPMLLVHGWWNVSGAKMSKSLGNVVDPNQLADKYGAEALRYYVMSDIATGKDSDFSEERLVLRYNTDLANNLGNLLNRTLNMAQKYRAGKVTRSAEAGLSARAGECAATHARLFTEFAIDGAMSQAQALATEANQFIEQRTPWKLAKDPGRAAELDLVLYQLAESLRIIAILISPVLPKAAAGIFAQLNWDKPFALADAQWGGLPDGHILGQPTPLFPRIETPQA